MRTDYPLTKPSAMDLIKLFGSADAALKYTGGQDKLACFYLANPDQRHKAQQVACVAGPLTHALKEARRYERDRARDESKRAAAIALAERVRQCWKNEGLRATSTIATAIGVSRRKVARIVADLKIAGKISDADRQADTTEPAP